MRTRALGLTALILAAMGGCDTSSPAAPASSSSNVELPAPAGPARWLGSSLLECPTSTTEASSAVVSALGGVVSAGGVTISIPAGALLGPVTVTVTTPASRYLEADISVEGTEHFLFQVPVVVTMSYARCTRSNIDFTPLTAWHIDTDTKELLEQMPSLDNKLTRTVTFTTGHLSGYALAN